MEEKKDLHDDIKIDDSVSFEIKVKGVKEEIASFTDIIDKLHRIRIRIIGVLILLILLCVIPFFLSNTLISYERMIFAAIGLLTFISIFYSLLLSDIGRIVLGKTNELIERGKEKIQRIAVKEIQGTEIRKLENVEKITYEANKKITELEEMKKIIDIESYLVMSVFCLLISIILALFNVLSYQQTAYAFFSAGFCFSGTIVILWRSLPKILDILEKQLGQEG
jgi:hypothetical protein